MAHVPAITHGGVVLTGPAAAGSAGQLLATDGAGGLHFVSPAGMEHEHPQSDVTHLVSDLAALQSHAGSTGNPHAVTKGQVGLGNVDNVQQQPLSSVLSTLAGSATAFGLSLIDDASAAAARGTLVVPQAPAANGTAEVSKALVPDANLDLAGLRHLTLTGKLGIGTSPTESLELGAGGNIKLRDSQAIVWGSGAGGTEFQIGNGSTHVLAWYTALTQRMQLSSAGLALTVPLLAAQMKGYTVGTLPTAGTNGRLAIATNGRKAGEGSGAGSGCPVWDDGVNWRTNYDNSVVSA